MNIQSIPGGGYTQIDSAQRRQAAPVGASEAGGTDTAVRDVPVQQQPVAAKENAEQVREQVKKAVEDVNSFVSTVNNSIQFRLDNDSGRSIVSVVDTGTKQIIRQFPSEEVLAISKALDNIKGLLIQQKA